MADQAWPSFQTKTTAVPLYHTHPDCFKQMQTSS